MMIHLFVRGGNSSCPNLAKTGGFVCAVTTYFETIFSIFCGFKGHRGLAILAQAWLCVKYEQVLQEQNEGCLKLNGGVFELDEILLVGTDCLLLQRS